MTAVTGIAGCVDSGDDPDGITGDYLHVRNDTDRPREVSVLVRRGGTTATDGRYRVPAGDGGYLDLSLPTAEHEVIANLHDDVEWWQSWRWRPRPCGTATPEDTGTWTATADTPMQAGLVVGEDDCRFVECAPTRFGNAGSPPLATLRVGDAATPST